jgi:hypothetical protein
VSHLMSDCGYTLKLTEACKRMVDVLNRASGDCVRASRMLKHLRLDVTNVRHSAIILKLYGVSNSKKDVLLR